MKKVLFCIALILVSLSGFGQLIQLRQIEHRPVEVTSDKERVLIGTEGTPGTEEDSLGYMTVYSTDAYADTRRAMPVTFTEDADIISISIYHVSGKSGNFIVGVYSDSGGLPADLLGSSSATAITSAEEWQEINLSASVSVTSGQKVWLVWVSNISGTVIKFQGGMLGVKADANNLYANGMPASFGASSLVYFNYSIYCNYEVATAGTAGITDDGYSALQIGGDVRITSKLQSDSLVSNTGVFGKINLTNSITKFSVDGTFSENSNSYVPTEAAVKTYVDNHTATLNDSTVSLSGTTPTWNLTDAPNAILTLTGTTTITFDDVLKGFGIITVTNAATAYDITFSASGYTIDFADVIHKTGDTVVTSGGAKKDRYQWSYDGYTIFITGILDSK